MTEEKLYTSKNKVDLFESLMPLLTSLYGEFKELSKKNPDAAISKSKIAIVNRLLNKIRDILNDQESIAFLDILEEDSLPQTSDVTIILSQYVAAMKAFKDMHYGWTGMEHQWFIKK